MKELTKYADVKHYHRYFERNQICLFSQKKGNKAEVTQFENFGKTIQK